MEEISNLKCILVNGEVEIQISQNAKVIEAKKKIHAKRPDAPPYRQKLFVDFDGSRTPLEDDRTLSSYPSIKSDCTLALIIQPPYTIYIQDPANDKIQKIEIPSKDPESYKISELKKLFKQAADFEFQFDDTPIKEIHDDKEMTLKDWNIRKNDTIFIMKTGQFVDTSSPEVDICFMVDCTGSMGKWIESVKGNVKSMRDKIEEKYKNESDLRFSFVRYTDYDQSESTRTTWIDFTKSLEEFHSFVNPISADGGGDTPEDIMGALKITFLNLSWRPSAAKVLIHIADAPCHGKQYHDSDDTYPNGDPAGITHEQMMDEVVRLKIQYFFAYINKDLTDQMINVFNDYLEVKSGESLMIRDADATVPDQLTEAVFKSVKTSVTNEKAKAQM